VDSHQEETRITNGLTKSLVVFLPMFLKGQFSDTKFMQLFFLVQEKHNYQLL